MKEHNWDILHRWETKEKVSFLKKLTTQQGFRIFQALYDIAYKFRDKEKAVNLNLEKINTLVKIRSIFKSLDL